MIELLEAFAGGVIWLGAFGLLVLALRVWTEWSVSLAVLVAYPLFFTFQVGLAKSLNALGLLSVPSLRVSFAAVMVVGGAAVVLRGGWRLAAIDRTPESTTRARTTSAEDADAVLIRRLVVVTVALVMAGLTLFTLVTPVHIWDVLAYHMPMVASYVQNASLEAWPTQDLRQVYRVNGGELQMLTVALLTRSDAWVELPNLLALGVLLLATFKLTAEALGRQALAWLVIGVTLTAPQILLGATTAKNDLVFSAILLCAFYWVIRAGMERHGQAALSLALAGLSCAIAAATKVMGLNVVAAVFSLALLLTWRQRWPARRMLVLGGTFAVALLVLAGDVYWANLGRSAVPVGIAPNEVAFSFGLSNLTEAARFYVYELAFKRLVIPQRFEHDFMHFGLLFPALLVLGIAGALRQLRQPRYVLGALAFAGAILFGTVIAVRLPVRWDQRFMIWLVPVLAVLGISVIRKLHVRYLLTLTGAAVALTVANIFVVLTNEADGMFNGSAIHLVQTGELARYGDVAQNQYAHMYDGYDVLDAVAAPGDSVLYVGSDDSWMYPAWGRRFTRYVEGVSDRDHAVAQLLSRRFHYVVVEDIALPEIRMALEEHAGQAGYEVLHRARGRVLLRLEAPPDSRGPGA